LSDWRWKGIGPPFLRVRSRTIRYQRCALQHWIHAQMQAAARAGGTRRPRPDGRTARPRRD